MPQVSYGDTLTPLYPGQVYDNMRASDFISLINSAPQAGQVSVVTVGGATNDKTYTLTILGVAVSYLSDASATVEEIVDGLVAAVNASSAVNGYVSAVKLTSSTLSITGSAFGVLSFDISEDDAQLSIATTAADLADPVRFGLGVVKTADRVGRLPASSDFVGARHTLVFTASNSQTYTVTFSVGGNTRTASFTADASATKAEITTGLKAAIDAFGIPGLVTTAVNSGDDLQIDAPAGQDLVIGATSAGTGAIAVTRNNGPSKPAEVYVAAYADNADDDLLAQYGILDGFAYPGNATMSCARAGRLAVRVEDTPALSSDVFLRVAANGALDEIGSLRATFNTGCVNLSQLYPGKFNWFKTVTVRAGQAALAVLQCNG